MLVHNITLYKPPIPVVKDDTEVFKGIHYSEAHKRFIHKRALKRCKFEINEKVAYWGKSGVITNIIQPDNYPLVEWKDLECRFVEVYLDDCAEFILVHPSTLNRRKPCPI